MSIIYRKVGCCKCGDEIWMEFLPTGNKWIYRFFDLNHNETNYTLIGAIQ